MVTSIEMREQLQRLIEQELLGPADGPEEWLEESNVRGRYILGQLAPKDQSQALDEVDDLAQDGDESAPDGKSDSKIPQAAAMLPNSLGLTCNIALTETAFEVTVRWGRYIHETETRHTEKYETDELGNLTVKEISWEQSIWKRQQMVWRSGSLSLREGRVVERFADAQETVKVYGECRRREDAWVVTLFMVNEQFVPRAKSRINKRVDEYWVFQPELIVTAVAADNVPIFVRRNVPDGLLPQNREDRTMQMLYRQYVEFGVGHGVGLHVVPSPDQWDRAVRIETRVIPQYEVEKMDVPSADDIPLLAGLVTDMKVLSETAQGGFGVLLRPLVVAYQAWIDARERESVAIETFQPEAAEVIAHCRATLARIEAGIALLDRDRLSAEAFQFANRAMHLQRTRSIFVKTKRKGETPDETKIDIAKNRSWRPFQLAFLLLNMAGLRDPADSERDQLADLLWFPTGGGKTEAYLGVAAFAIGMRRLQGNLSGLGTEGVAVLMRYTLRLLTLQQFQRATTLICACEMIRRDNPLKWGQEPFRIGLWVGAKTTPNWTEEAKKAVEQAMSGKGYEQGSPLQLKHCPWCGTEIKPKDVHVTNYPDESSRTIQYCGDNYGRCAFSKVQANEEGIPIVVVDEEIYRRLPTLLIATVDKFAQMPWNGRTQMLFGKVDGHCPRHGFVSSDVEDKTKHPKSSTHPACKLEPRTGLRPPDLIIQDELHLISGPLGTLVGLYETAVDALGSWQLNGVTIRPKVIASTATIRRAKEQVHNLFARDVRVFPPVGIEAGDNFFSIQQPSTVKQPGRLYVGICAPGTRLKSVLIRVYVAYMAAAQKLYETMLAENQEALIDPYMTLVGYFNAMRELGGMRRVVDDAVRTRLRMMDRRLLAKRYINPAGGDLEELTSRKKSTDIPDILDRLDVTFSRESVGEGKVKTQISGRKLAERPLDVVLATNMISVGVDVDRLGLMVMAGQPKATAEYIQATSRVGRKFPGLVCTVYNWARPRDLSHYERFEHYHATFYQQVEALSVTPFASRALDRGLSGVLVSLVRLAEKTLNGEKTAGDVAKQPQLFSAAIETIRQRTRAITHDPAMVAHVEGMLQARQEAWVRDAEAKVGTPLHYRKPHTKEEARGLLKQSGKDDWELFTCLNSLRDVEPSVNLILNEYEDMDKEPAR